MSISLVLASLRCALPALPSEWALWSIDRRGVLLAHEGPAAAAGGGDAAVGTSVWEVYRSEEAILGFAKRVLRDRAAVEVVAGGRRIHLSGGPRVGGGAEGMALVLGRAEEQGSPDGPAAARAVLELLRPVPEIGADTGDLLLAHPKRPSVVGLYREIPARSLPPEVERDLRLTRSGGGPGSAPPPSTHPGALRPLRERAAHLRVVS